MKYADIWPLVVDGFRVTCERFGPGTFVDYQFNGLRINHAGGSSSGFTPREEDMACEWSLVPDDPPHVAPKAEASKWGKPTLPNVSDMLVLDPTTGAWVEAGTVPPGTYQVKVKDNWGKPAPPANVGNDAPKRDSWGRPLQTPGKWGK